MLNYNELTSQDLHKLGVTIDDLSGDLRFIAEIVGLDIAFKLILMFGGEAIYFPKKDSMLRKPRDIAIKEQFDGSNLMRFKYCNGFVVTSFQQ